MGAGVTSLATHNLDLRDEGIDYRLLRQHFQVVGNLSLSRLLKLFLCNNKLSSLPPEISICCSLRELHCKNNWLKWLPEEVKALTQLQLLRLGANALLDVSTLVSTPSFQSSKAKTSMKHSRPSTSEQDDVTEGNPLSKLTTLRIGHNRIRSLPDQMNSMCLTSIVANNNHITVLPADLFLMTSMQSLVLSNNFICMLPDSISKAEQLQVLVLTNNRLETLPASIGSRTALTQLVQLHLDRNLLRQLPGHMDLLPRITQLVLANNNLTLQEIKASSLLHSKSLRSLVLTPGNVNMDEVININDPRTLRDILTPRRSAGSNSNSQRSGRSGRRSARSSGRSQGRHTDRSARQSSRSPGGSETSHSASADERRGSSSVSPGRSRGRRRDSSPGRRGDSPERRPSLKGQASPGRNAGRRLGRLVDNKAPDVDGSSVAAPAAAGLGIDASKT